MDGLAISGFDVHYLKELLQSSIHLELKDCRDSVTPDCISNSPRFLVLFAINVVLGIWKFSFEKNK